MHIKRGTAAALTLMLLLTGCKGTVDGRETMELAADYMNDETYAAPFPGMKTETQVQDVCRQFLKNVWDGEYEKAMTLLPLNDLTFVDITTLKGYVESYGLTSDASITYTEYLRDGANYVDCKAEGYPTLTIKADVLTDGVGEADEASGSSPKFQLTLTDFVATNYTLHVPKGTLTTLDGKDLTEYSTDGENFVIPYISKGNHEVSMSNIFVQGIGTTVDVQGGTTDLSTLMYVQGDLRGQLIKLAAQTLTALNNAIIADDWEKFRTYFVPDMNMSDFSVPFHAAYNAKSAIYGLTQEKVKDLEQVDHMDVRYTGYDTVEVKLGTAWKWAAKGAFQYNEKTDTYKVTRWSNMNMVNTLELYYDGKTLYVKNIDDASLTRLTAGLEEWR